MILPSGRVTITERPFEIKAGEVTIGLQSESGNGDSMEHTDNATQSKVYG